MEAFARYNVLTFMAHNKKLKVGVVGIGHLGSIHAKLWKQVHEAECIGIYDENRESAARVASETGLRAFDDLFELIHAVDALSVVTPTFAHYAVARDAIDRGKHVLIEKPITTTVSEANDLSQRAAEKHVKIQVGHIERFNPALIAVEPYLTDPKFFESHRMAQFKPRGTDVPVVLDLMVHDIDVILSLVKSPVASIDASGVAVVSEQLDIANARIKFENGAVANVTASRISQNPLRKLRIFEQRAYLSIDFANKSTEIFRLVDEAERAGITTPMMMLGEIEQADIPRSIIYERPAVKDINPLKYELELFVHAIMTGTRPIVSGEDGMKALEVAEQIIHSIGQNHSSPA
jgi:predicted dehydrogenase